MSPEGNYLSMEPFLTHVQLAAPIDMELGPDGKLYILEYGKGWFTKNPDAGISRIDYIKGDKLPQSVLNTRKPGGTVAPSGHQKAVQAPAGKLLMLKSDCSTCHKINETSIGPSFIKVSAKYKKNSNAVSYLAGKIIKGSSGVWAEVPMPAHPAMKEAEAKQIASWIMSLSAK
ncbi:Cytochrome c-552 precursor [compost metagenome]